jgi:isopenicillin-N epimerase
VLLTDHEYGAMRFCFDRLAHERRWQVREVALPCPATSSQDIVARFEAAVSPRTRVLFFSHVTSPTGLVLPAESLCALAARHGIVSIVDGAHAPGMLRLDLEEIGADYYAGNCHKWMMAPTGAAFLYCQPQHKGRLRPLITSWGWDYDSSAGELDSGWGGSYWARHLEFIGTQDRCAQMALPIVLDFRARLGEEAIERRVADLVAYTRSRIAEAGYPPATPASRQLSGSMTAFEFPALDPVKARDWMWREHRIEAPFTAAAGRIFLRVSTAWFNTPEEIGRLADALTRFPPNRAIP